MKKSKGLSFSLIGFIILIILNVFVTILAVEIADRIPPYVSDIVFRGQLMDSRYMSDGVCRDPYNPGIKVVEI